MIPRTPSGIARALPRPPRTLSSTGWSRSEDTRLHPSNHRTPSATTRTSRVAIYFARASPMHTRCSTKCRSAMPGNPRRQRPNLSAIPCRPLPSRCRPVPEPRSNRHTSSPSRVSEPCPSIAEADEQCPTNSEPMNSNRRGIFLITKFS